MKKKMITNEMLSTYCLNLSMLLGAGVPTEEAASVLCESESDVKVKDFSNEIAAQVKKTGSFAKAISSIEELPVYMRQMITVGEESGRLEAVLHSLSQYYSEQAEMQSRIRTAVLYPTVLLLVMSVILLFMMLSVLPVFQQVYTSLMGVTETSFSYLNIAKVLGWIAFAITFLFGFCILAGYILWSNGKCHAGILKILSKFKMTKASIEENSLAQFTASFATYVASGVDTDTAMEKSKETADNKHVRDLLEKCSADMKAGKSFVQASREEKLYTPLYMSLLASGAKTGNLDQALSELSARVYSSSKERIATLTDAIEPVLAAVLTICVGLLLTAVMLPLIGIMGSIG